METFKFVSIRGRMAYVLCLFEKLLLYFSVEKEEWKWILEKLWVYTEVEYLDDWMYEIAEFLPDSILNDKYEAFEFISEEQYNILREIYAKNQKEINDMMNIIFELGTVEMYSELINNSPYTLSKIQEAVRILEMKHIELVNSKPFEQYSYSHNDGWGKRFDGKVLSIFL